MQRLRLYLELIRLDKPVGIFLLLWPTLIGLWMASGGQPDGQLVFIFCVGTVLMRSAGCAVNDIADRHFDRHVQRTASRPLTSGAIKVWEAIFISIVLALLAFGLIWPLNLFTKQLSVLAVLIAASYPYFKRFFSIPQAYLGIAFGFGIVMAFSAVQNQIPFIAWLLLSANIFWAVAYDTEYAMVDRADDVKIGIRTSAITFGRFDVLAVVGCYVVMFLLFVMVGYISHLGHWFWIGLGGAMLCALYHYLLIRQRVPERCFVAFKHNNWLGAFIFLGVVLDYWSR